MQTLYLIGGPPGSGKTSFSKRLISEFRGGSHVDSISRETWINMAEDSVMIASDDWFDNNTDGVFTPKFLSRAHNWCLNQVKEAFEKGVENIIVHNTLTNMGERGADPYLSWAKEQNIPVFMMYMVNHHGNSSVHNVPSNTVQRMAEECANTIINSVNVVEESVE